MRIVAISSGAAAVAASQWACSESGPSEAPLAKVDRMLPLSYESHELKWIVPQTVMRSETDLSPIVLGPEQINYINQNPDRLSFVPVEIPGTVAQAMNMDPSGNPISQLMVRHADAPGLLIPPHYINPNSIPNQIASLISNGGPTELPIQINQDQALAYLFGRVDNGLIFSSNELTSPMRISFNGQNHLLGKGSEFFIKPLKVYGDGGNVLLQIMDINGTPIKIIRSSYGILPAHIRDGANHAALRAHTIEALLPENHPDTLALSRIPNMAAEGFPNLAAGVSHYDYPSDSTIHPIYFVDRQNGSQMVFGKIELPGGMTRPVVLFNRQQVFYHGFSPNTLPDMLLGSTSPKSYADGLYLTQIFTNGSLIRGKSVNVTMLGQTMVDPAALVRQTMPEALNVLSASGVEVPPQNIGLLKNVQLAKSPLIKGLGLLGVAADFRPGLLANVAQFTDCEDIQCIFDGLQVVVSEADPLRDKFTAGDATIVDINTLIAKSEDDPNKKFIAVLKSGIIATLSSNSPIGFYLSVDRMNIDESPLKVHTTGEPEVKTIYGTNNFEEIEAVPGMGLSIPTISTDNIPLSTQAYADIISNQINGTSSQEFVPYIALADTFKVLVTEIDGTTRETEMSTKTYMTVFIDSFGNKKACIFVKSYDMNRTA